VQFFCFITAPIKKIILVPKDVVASTMILTPVEIAPKLCGSPEIQLLKSEVEVGFDW
jgi:hypothetical protein